MPDPLLAQLPLLAPLSFTSPLAGVALALVLCATALPLIALTKVFAASNRLLNANLGRQLFVLACLLAGVLGFCGLLWLARMGQVPKSLLAALPPSGLACGMDSYVWWHTPLRGSVLGLGGLCIAIILLSSMLARGWRTLRATPLQLWAGSLVLTALVPAIWLLPLHVFGPYLPAHPLAALLDGTDWLWLCAVLVACADSLGAGTGILWMLIRRKRDLFGDDYPPFAVRALARVAAGGGLLMTIGLGALWAALAPLRLPPLAPLGVLLPLAATLAWRFIARDKDPMRGKILMFAGWTAMLAAVILLTRMAASLS